MKILINLILFSLFSLVFGNTEDVPKEPVRLTIDQFENKYLVLNFENHPGWHTYWKNPGDAGIPITPQFFVNDKQIDLESLEWPAPQIFTEQNGDLTTFGYKGRFSLFYKIPENIGVSFVTAKVSWLVCKNICIPGQKEIRGKILGNDFVYEGKEKIFTLQEINKNFNSLPKTRNFPENLDLILTKDKESGLNLFYTLNSPIDPKTFKLSGNLLFPFPSHPFNFKKEDLFQDSQKNIYGKMNIVWDGEYSEQPEPLPENGIFTNPHTLKFLYMNPQSNEYEVIEKTFSSFDLAGFDKSEEVFKLLSPFIRDKEAHQSLPSSGTSFWYYFLFALIGGLLLNAMPCVLPVISLKIFYLIKHKKTTQFELIKHNLSYCLGILFTFAVLASIIVSLKSTGEIIGWGFQLQSPQFIALMIFILFIFSLNLFGLFNFITPGGKFLGNIHLNEGYLGDFLSGILTTILATPCSAPFLGTALTFAFTSSTQNIFLIFGGIGFGLAMPFLLVGLFPALISILPRPGQWMESLKQFLGLTLILTIVWLFDVFIQLNPPPYYILYLGTSLSLVFFAFYARKHISKNRILLLVLLLVPGLILGKLVLTRDISHDLSSPKGDISWQPWSVEKMEQVKLSGQYAFIDFTAKWCLTCKVNEALVLKTSSFEELAKKHQMVLLLADWTKRDKNITEFLFSQGKVGVPAYFILDKNGNLIDLGETISINKISQHLK